MTQPAKFSRRSLFQTKWTQDRVDQVIKLRNEEHLSYEDIAHRLKLTNSEVRYKVLNLHRRNGMTMWFNPKTSSHQKMFAKNTDVQKDINKSTLARRPVLKAGHPLTWGCLNDLIPNVGPFEFPTLCTHS